MSERQRIFISSVQREFAEERRALRAFIEGDALLGRFFEVFVFEGLSARDQRPDAAYLTEVDRCDVYVGLFGSEYGFEGADGVSPTEHEFDRATLGRKTRLVFLRGGDGSARHLKMRALVQKAESQLVRRRFDSIPELQELVRASLVERLIETRTIATKPFDASACSNATLDDLSEERIEAFLELARRARGFPLDPKTPPPAALAHLNLLDGESPSHAAVLLFAKQPQRFLISSEVKCAHFHGTHAAKPIPSYQIFKGTVFQLVDQAVDFVLTKISRAVGTRSQGAQAPVAYELPIEAVTEAIVNAIAHRDYASNASVQVMLFADRLEVWNPGELPPSLTPEALRSPHPSIPRNPLLAEPLFLTRYVEKAGTGTLDMIELCRLAGLASPEFRQEGATFVQLLRRPAALATGQVTGHVEAAEKAEFGRWVISLSRAFPDAAARLTGQVAAQVAQLCREPRSGREIMAALGLRHRETFLTNYLEPLLAAGILERTIPGKPRSRLQKYRLTDRARGLVGAHG